MPPLGIRLPRHDLVLICHRVHPGSSDIQVPAWAVPGRPRFAIVTPSATMNVSAPRCASSMLAAGSLPNPFSSHFCCVAFLMGRKSSTVYISDVARPSSIHRSRPRRFPNLSPMPRPIPASSLHDGHDRRALVIEAVRHRFADEPNRLLALGVALGLDDVVGIVEQDAVAALAGGDTPDRLQPCAC
jgi:hypothetical protein